ncbi:MAG: FAD-dependent oxidoreductase [Chitinophagaceae bacterium]
MSITIIGGGIIGLCTAYYLRKEGYEVTVVDRHELKDGCSFGNMGYISPSHFVPLATPGIIRQGLKWMMDSSSPFYIKPRLDMDLIRWGLLFSKSATAANVKTAVPALNGLLQLSRELTVDLERQMPEAFSLHQQGCWMLYKQEKTGHHEKELTEQAAALGLRTRICTAAEVQAMEPEVEVDVLGGVLYEDDCHVQPAQLMQALYKQLLQQGVKFWLNTDVLSVETQQGTITRLITSKGELPCGQLVVANGSWMGLFAKKLGIKLAMQPGKGYSMEFTNLGKNLQRPSILVDDRVATTPVGSWLRIGGTMELSGHSEKVLPRRVEAIARAFARYYPDMNLPAVDPSQAWYGYRPVTPDGLPYIGAHSRYSNLYFAGGHAMLGVSAAAATGLLIAELLGGKKTSQPLTAFSPERFS